LNKPRGYVTTVHDPEGRPTVVDLLRGVRARVYPVGRLDYASEGLLLLTNDGELAHGLMRAASHVPKVYLVKVAGQPDASGLEKLRRGLTIPAERSVHAARREFQANDLGRGKDLHESRRQPRIKTAPAKIRVVREAENPWYEVTLTEGKNRQIRKMFEEIGHHVEKIKRVKFGSLVLDVHPGEHRHLSLAEVQKLRAATGLPRS